MTGAHEGQHWKWNHCPWMPPLLYDRGSWRSTLEVKSLSLNASPTIWQRLIKVNIGSEITVLECLPYYMTEAQEGLNWKWNHCPWMSPLLYDSNSWRSTPEVKSLSLNASPTIWQWLMKVNTGSENTDLECLPYYMTGLMKVNTGSEITVLECLPYYMTGAHEGQHWKWNHCPWMPILLYDRGSWKSTLEVKYLSLNASPTIWEWLMKVNTGSEISILECLPYYMTVAHEGHHWKWYHCPWMPPLQYDSGSWRSTLEVKSLSLNVSPNIWQRLMKVNTGSEITVLECLPYYMTVAQEGHHWKWNHCTWMPPLLYGRDSCRSTLEVKSLPWMPPLLYDSGSRRSKLEVKSLSLNVSPSIWQ